MATFHSTAGALTIVPVFAEDDGRDREDRLAELQCELPVGEKDFTTAGFRKRIASLNAELVIFEGSEEASAASIGRVALFCFCSSHELESVLESGDYRKVFARA